MTTKEIIKISKTKAHTIYKNSAGKRVPGVTTILGILNKPALVPWANRLGLQGIDCSKYTDEKAAVGTLAHAKIMAHFRGCEIDDSEFSKVEINQADNSLLSFFEWAKGKDIEPLMIEEALVSETYQYGGALDLVADIDGEITLVDYKTGSGIYEEAAYQISAYGVLAAEKLGRGYIKKYRIINIGRDETEGFSEKTLTNIDKQFEVFRHCLDIYRLKKELKNGK